MRQAHVFIRGLFSHIRTYRDCALVRCTPLVPVVTPPNDEKQIHHKQCG